MTNYETLFKGISEGWLLTADVTDMRDGLKYDACILHEPVVQLSKKGDSSFIKVSESDFNGYYVITKLRDAHGDFVRTF